MNRMILAAAVMASALAYSLRGAAEARETPWCAISPMGWDDVIEDCSYWSLEACIP